MERGKKIIYSILILAVVAAAGLMYTILKRPSLVAEPSGQGTPTPSTEETIQRLTAPATKEPMPVPKKILEQLTAPLPQQSPRTPARPTNQSPASPPQTPPVPEDILKSLTAPK